MGPPLQLPGVGHNGRDMLLFLILFFYKKNQCQSTDPLKKSGRPGRASSPCPQLRGSVVRGALPGLQDKVGPGLCSPQAPLTKGFTSHLNVQPTPAVGKALRPAPASCCCPVPEPVWVPLPRARIGGLWAWRGGGSLSATGADTEKPQGHVMEGVLSPCS